MKVLALYNSKGGVGKTTAAVNLAHMAAEGGQRVLLWDLDPQGASSFYFRVPPGVKGGARALMSRDRPLQDAIRGSGYPSLDLLPSDFSYRKLELRLDEFRRPHQRLARVLRPLRDEYDLVMLDCPAGIGLVAEAAIGASDIVLVPVIPTTLARRTLDQVAELCRRDRFENVRLLPFVSMMDRRKRLHHEVARELGEAYPELLSVAIPMASEIERMGVAQAPLASFAPRSSPGLAAYRRLWEELSEQVWPAGAAG